MPADAIVEVKDVGKTYEGGVEALADVNLALPQGRLSTLLGPSGCGKTTLLKIIAGLIPPSRGEVWVKGKKVDGPGPERAFVFQDFALLPWGNVLRNVGFRSGAARPAQRRARCKSPANISRRSGSNLSNRAIRTSSRAACASGSGSPAPSPSMPILS